MTAYKSGNARVKAASCPDGQLCHSRPQTLYPRAQGAGGWLLTQAARGNMSGHFVLSVSPHGSLYTQQIRSYHLLSVYRGLVGEVMVGIVTQMIIIWPH